MPTPKKASRIRKNINTNRLVGILNNHIFDPENNPLSTSQLKAADMLLKRSLPELRSIEHKGKIDSKIEVSITRED